MTKPEFKHLGENGFPHAGNVNVYDYDNAFDYARYDYSQMHIMLCNVPWDSGEVHVGQRTMSGVGNVVYFESAKARDEWFSKIPDSECYQFDTKFKELHSDLQLLAPLPFDVACRYNYVRVDYEIFANAQSPIMYENETGVRSWFYFIRSVEFIAPNTTRLILLDDAWQTWIYDMDVTGMVLERGHAPEFAVSATDYLASPIDHTDYLMAEDVSFGEVERVASTDVCALNAGEMWACVACTSWWGNIDGTNWGTVGQDGWQTPMQGSCHQDGQPGYYIFAVAPSDLWDMFVAIDKSYPQFKQTVAGVFFIPKNLVETHHDFTMAGYACVWVRAQNNVSLDLTKLTLDKFGYGADYENIAKLYTWPYAALEVTDENGDSSLIRIEDTTGTIDVTAAVNLAFPAIKLSARLTGAGGKTSGSITFRNVTEHTFDFSGRWYAYLREWGIPVFAVLQDNATYYNMSTYYDRVQRANDYSTAQSNTNASAEAALANANANAATAQTNAGTMASTAKSNADANADTMVSNAETNTTANVAVTTRGNTAASADVGLTNDLAGILTAYDNGYTQETTNNDVEAANASAAVGAASSTVSSVVGGAISGAMSGGPAAGATAAVGALAGLANGVISGASAIAQNTIAVNLTETQASAAIAQNNNKNTMNRAAASDRTNIQNAANTDITGLQNDAITATTANSAATVKANATRSQTATNTVAAATYATETANAQRTYDATVANAQRTATSAQAAIDNAVKQAALDPPRVFGEFANGGNSTTRPMALFANVVTQSQGAIALAGDAFLRYGYNYGKYWNFDGNWNIGKHFTYWKLKDFWFQNLAVPDAYADRIRYFLFGGVTVWRDPNEIGKVSIYDNAPD